jgi:hypothetical protein
MGRSARHWRGMSFLAITLIAAVGTAPSHSGGRSAARSTRKDGHVRIFGLLLHLCSSTGRKLLQIHTRYKLFAAIVKRQGSTDPDYPTNAPADDGLAKKDRHRAGWGLGKAADMFANQLGREKVEIIEDNPGKEGLEGVGVGAVNIYLVVFADGVVSVRTRSESSLIEVPFRGYHQAHSTGFRQNLDLSG